MFIQIAIAIEIGPNGDGFDNDPVPDLDYELQGLGHAARQ